MTTKDIKPDETTNNKKKKKWLIILLLALLLLGGGVGYWYVTHQPEQKTTVVSGKFLPDDKDASKMTNDEIAKYAQAAVDKSKFQMIINPDITVEGGKSDLYIQNPPNNSYPIDVTITLDNGDVVYQSGGIKIGYEVKNATMDKQLDKGNYTGTALFKLYNQETSEEKGQVTAEITISVK